MKTVSKINEDLYKLLELGKINKIIRHYKIIKKNFNNDDADIIFYQLGAGNLSSLAKLTNLREITFSDYKQNSGDIMDFINPWIQAGRTSGKLRVIWLLGQKKITLNGSPITYPSGVSNESAYLNWTSDGTVTFTAS